MTGVNAGVCNEPVVPITNLHCSWSDRGKLLQLLSVHVTMAASSSETYLGHNYTVSQLLNTAKKKLTDAAFGARCVQDRRHLMYIDI